jgi:hypothetical protein
MNPQSRRDKEGTKVVNYIKFKELYYMEQLNEEYVIDSKGNKKSVIIPIKKYTQLLEDLHDLSVINERKDEETIDFDEMKSRLFNN